MVIFIGNYSQANNALVIPVVGCGVFGVFQCVFVFVCRGTVLVSTRVQILAVVPVLFAVGRWESQKGYGMEF